MTENEQHRNAPIDMSSELFRKLGYEVVDSLALLFDSFRERAVTNGSSPSAIRKQLGQGGLPDNGEDPGRILSSATELLFNNSTFNGHPRFLGYITASPAPIGVLGELLAAGVNPNVGAWSLSPAATEIERQAVRWVAELIGFPVECGGLFVSGGNMANMVCLLVARATLVSERSNGTDPSIENRKLRIYASTETHTWIEKAVDILGLGDDALRRIEVDGRGRIKVGLLRDALKLDRDLGFVPLCVIGTAGTTNTGAIDPLRELAGLCSSEGIWFHVDGAYGAPAAALPGASDDLVALASADSVSVDPHKWLYAPLEAGCALIRNGSLLRQTFEHNPPYYHFGEEEGEPVFNYHEYGPQNSRGFRALKVWLGLRQVGRSGYVKMIRDDIALARLLFDRVSENQYLQAVSCELSITTFAFVPPDLSYDRDADYLNELNTELLSRLQHAGSVYLSNALVDGQFLLRACVVNFRTSAADIERIVELVVEAGTSLDQELRKAATTNG